MANAFLDENSRQTLTAVSNVDQETIVNVYADPVTHRLLVDVGGTGTGVQSVTGLNTDNTDPQNPIVQISVDGSTITGTGTPGDPLVATASSNITVYTETPSGDVDGVNTTYTTLNTINSILSFAINGQYIHPFTSNPEAGANYTFTGSSITFTTPLAADLSGLPFTIVYI